MERPAITCFKEVLKACPLAVEAAQTLMMMGVKPKEIQAITSEVTSSEPLKKESLPISNQDKHVSISRPSIRPRLVRPVGLCLLCLQQQRLRFGHIPVLPNTARTACPQKQCPSYSSHRTVPLLQRVSVKGFEQSSGTKMQ